MKKVIYTLFILSGLLPATYLLIIAGLLLVDNFSSIFKETSSLKVIISVLMGMCGYAALVLALIPKFQKKHLVKISLAVVGIVGFALFITLANSGMTWDWFLKMEEPDAWIIFMWPNIVCIFIIMINIVQWYKKKKII